jgi:hypothetical protein
MTAQHWNFLGTLREKLRAFSGFLDSNYPRKVSVFKINIIILEFIDVQDFPFKCRRYAGAVICITYTNSMLYLILKDCVMLNSYFKL